MFMEVATGYGKPPWVFRGRALYQLHLVKSSTARALIPRDFRLIEVFGYTLGGFFLASYDDSPAGIFDELVVIAGLIWNNPSSCAWASRVLVSSDEACLHGREAVGLPSHVARFSKRIKALPRQPSGSRNRFLDMIGFSTTICAPGSWTDVQVSELKGPTAMDLCTINLATDLEVSALKPDKDFGPAIKISLPSFSGCTKYSPNILKYSCNIECRVRPVKPAKVSGPFVVQKDGVEQSSEENIEIGRKLSISVMLSKPILALEFNWMKMAVDAPTIVPHCPQHT